MNGLKGSRSAKLLAGIAMLSASALMVAGCAGGTDTPTTPTNPPTSDPGTGNERPTDLDLKLAIGSLLPTSGSLSFLGAPMESGVALAVAEVNAANAGITITHSPADEGDLDNKAYETSIERLRSENVSAIVGAASSSVSKIILEGNVGAGIITISPSNTSPDFTGINPLYFRTAPSDLLQGEVLGNQIAEDQHSTLGIIYQNDPYGTGLADAIAQTFEDTGGQVVAQASYNQGDGQFDAQVSEIAAANPSAVAIVSYDQFATIAPLLGKAGLDTGALYLVDGNLKDWPQLDVDLTGSKGTRAGADLPETFIDDLNEVWTGLGNDPIDAVTYSAEAYDAVILLALASLRAMSTNATDIAMYMQEVSGGEGDGQKCTDFAACAAIINAGGIADYDGLSGEITFDENNDPYGAAIGVYEFASGNTHSRIK